MVLARSTAPTVGTEQQPYSYALQASTDHEGDALLFEFTQAPAGARIHPRSGLIQWTPAWGQTGSQRFTVRVTSARFAGCSRVARHRLVYDALRLLMPAGIHALAIEARAPGER